MLEAFESGLCLHKLGTHRDHKVNQRYPPVIR